MRNHILDTGVALDRRALLKLLSASPLLLGVSSLLAATQGPQNPVPDLRKRPAWFVAALRQARSRQAPVVAVVVPDVTTKEVPTKALKRQESVFKKRLQALYDAKTPDGDGPKRPACRADAWFTINFQDRLSRMAVYLQLLLDSQDPAMQELLLEAVWVCAPARLLGAEKSEIVVTLDSFGRRTGGAILDLSDESDVVRKLQHLLHRNGKLRKRAAAARTPEIAAAFEDLASDSSAKRSKATARLLRDIQTLIPAIIETRHQHRDGAVRRGLDEIIAIACKRARKQDYRGVLPFGTELQQRSVYDPCPPCGMALVPAGTRKMLKLLGK